MSPRQTGREGFFLAAVNLCTKETLLAAVDLLACAGLFPFLVWLQAMALQQKIQAAEMSKEEGGQAQVGPSTFLYVLHVYIAFVFVCVLYVYVYCICMCIVCVCVCVCVAPFLLHGTPRFPLALHPNSAAAGAAPSLHGPPLGLFSTHLKHPCQKHSIRRGQHQASRVLCCLVLPYLVLAYIFSS